MKTIVVYFHGLGGSSETSKGKALKAALDSESVEVIIPDLDPNPNITALNTFQLVHSYFDGNKIPDVKFLFVGISLGGFYAKCFGEVLDIPYVIVNPVVKPSVTLRQFVGCKVLYADDMLEIDEDFVEKFTLVEKECSSISGYLAHVFVAKDDPLIPYQETLDAFKFAKSKHVFPDGGHDFGLHWPEVITTIKNFIS
jgi:predicted esterase YcpF (UPF0227 family)